MAAPSVRSRSRPCLIVRKFVSVPPSQRSVTTGTADDSFIAITSGLKEGEQVVVGPAKTLLFLIDGERLNANAKDVTVAKK